MNEQCHKPPPAQAIGPMPPGSEGLGRVAQQVPKHLAGNDRLPEQNDRPNAETERFRALVHQADGATTGQASQLLAGITD